MRTLVRSDAAPPAAGGAEYGSVRPARAGAVVPSRPAVTPWSRSTIVATVARKAGSVAWSDGLVTTTTSSSGSDSAPPACIAAMARPDSVCDSSAPLIAPTARIPPRPWLATKRPIVTANQPSSTGQR